MICRSEFQNRPSLVREPRAGCSRAPRRRRRPAPRSRSAGRSDRSSSRTSSRPGPAHSAQLDQRRSRAPPSATRRRTLRGSNTHLTPPQRNPAAMLHGIDDTTLPQVFHSCGRLTTILAPENPLSMLAIRAALLTSPDVIRANSVVAHAPGQAEARAWRWTRVGLRRSRAYSASRRPAVCWPSDLPPWMQDLGLLVEAVEAGRPAGAPADWQPGAVIRLPFSSKLCREAAWSARRR